MNANESLVRWISTIAKPPGLVGEIAGYIVAVAPRPVHEIALAAAIGFVAGISGRAFNVSGTGLNQYIMVLAPTGTGKEAMNRGVSKLVSAVNAASNGSDPMAKHIGPSEIRSDAALLKWLAKEPCFLSILGEIGIRLKQMCARNAINSETSVKRVLLDVYSKPGAGEVLNAMAYSDKEKIVPVVHSPAFTMIGESTPERFYEALDESMIYEGLLPRFTIIEYSGPRPELNENHAWTMPTVELIDRLSRLVTRVALLGSQNQTVAVAFTAESKIRFDEFNRFCDDQINAPGARELQRHMWTRAHVKALKLAATVAVGMDWENPIIDDECAMWATSLVVRDVTNIMGRFERGETGEVAGSEEKQREAVLRCIYQFVSGPWTRTIEGYGVPAEMHAMAIFTQSLLQRRTAQLPAFKDDRIGATNALHRAIKNLIEADEIREVPKQQLRDKFGIQPRSFILSDLQTFIEAGRIKYERPI